MSHISRYALAVGALSLAALVGDAAAQSPITWKLHCNVVGVAQPELIGDRPGHALQVGEQSCRVEGGPMDGALFTSSGISEVEAGGIVLLSAHGVVRKPGSMFAWQATEGSTTFRMTDGKVTGFAGKGKGAFTLVTGAATLLKGKTFSYIVNPAGPGKVTMDVTVD